MLSARYDLSRSRDAVVPINQAQKLARDALAAKLTDGRYSLIDHTCPICDGDSFEPLASRDRYGLPFQVVICRTCGLIQGLRYLSGASLGEFYAEDFPALHRSSKVPTDEKFEDRRKYAASIARWLSAHGIPKGRRLLDVGYSSGGILQGVIDHGFDGYGVEINQDYASYAKNKGLKVEVGTLESVLSKVEPEIVTYCQVLEHIPDLHRELSTLRDSITGDALVYLEVPGIKKLWPTYHFDFLRSLQLAHIWYFSLETLTALMSRYGFRLVTGDQTVRALFALDAEQATSVRGSDYDSALRALRRSEFVRKIYPLAAVRRAARLVRRARGR